MMRGDEADSWLPPPAEVSLSFLCGPLILAPSSCHHVRRFCFQRIVSRLQWCTCHCNARTSTQLASWRVSFGKFCRCCHVVIRFRQRTCTLYPRSLVRISDGRRITRPRWRSCSSNQLECAFHGIGGLKFNICCFFSCRLSLFFFAILILYTFIRLLRVKN